MRAVQFKIAMSVAQTASVTVDYTTQDDTAIAGVDYLAQTGKVTIPPGSTTATVTVYALDKVPVFQPPKSFKLVLTAVDGRATLPNPPSVSCQVNTLQPEINWLERFTTMYTAIKAPASGYFGPPTGPKARQVPYHAREKAIVVEAPDWSHESVSETVSFWVKLEAWYSILNNNPASLNTVWNTIESNWIPNAAQGQPWGAYTPDAPAGYTPDAHTLQETPMKSTNDFTVGADPLYQSLLAAYGTKTVYLMHWLLDVDGDYGFKNPDGTKTSVFINNYQRGPVEDGLATITHPCYDDYTNGGGPYGFQPIYNRSHELYSDGGPHDFSKQWNYSMAGDADSRAAAQIFWAGALMTSGTVPATVTNKAKKMTDYIRYTLYDKYFRPIEGQDGSGCHYLLSWGCGYGGGIPVSGNQSYWGFRIGNSEIHHGYNAVDLAYAASTGRPLAPLAAGSPAQWKISFDRQLELLRWLQTAEGPIAGGVSSSWRGRYEVPADGRQNAKFYGLYYNYSPSWFNPPSNNWTGFQAWGLERVSALYAYTSKLTDSENVSVAYRCGVILDKFVPWFYNNCTVDLANGIVEYPINTKYTSPTQIPGVTATEPTPVHGDYEYLPTLEWDGTGDYTGFWSNTGAVPNPNLHCEITEFGYDAGTASGFVQILIEYVQAKKQITGGLSGVIPNTTITFKQVLDKAADILSYIWSLKTPYGNGSPTVMDNHERFDDILWIPPEFGTGHMPNGEVLANGQTTFASMRLSLYEQTPEWPHLRAYLDGTEPNPPTVTYHRFWNQVDVACAYAMMHKYFPGYVSSASYL